MNIYHHLVISDRHSAFAGATTPYLIPVAIALLLGDSDSGKYTPQATSIKTKYMSLPSERSTRQSSTVAKSTRSTRGGRGKGKVSTGKGKGGEGKRKGHGKKVKKVRSGTGLGNIPVWFENKSAGNYSALTPVFFLSTTDEFLKHCSLSYPNSREPAWESVLDRVVSICGGLCP